MRRRHVRNAAVLATALCALTPAPALADADPASDVLVKQYVYLPYKPPVSKALGSRLEAAAAAADRKGYFVRVAIIATKADLGGVPNLFGQPQKYAGYLGPEISANYRQALVVVMPAGIGTYQIGPRGPKAIAGVTVARDAKADDLASTALTVVKKLAAAGRPKAPSNFTLENRTPTNPHARRNRGGDSGGSSLAPIIGGVAVALAVIGLGVAAYRRASAPEHQ